MGTKAAIFIAVSLFAVSCATPESRARPDAEVVKERSQARWDAMVKGDFKAGYRYVSPAGKAIYSEAQYENGYRRDFWTDAKVEKVVCPSVEVCEADVQISYKVNGVASRSPLREKWVKQGSDWWFVLER